MEYISESETALGMTQEPYGLALGELGFAADKGHDVSALRAEFDALDEGDASALMSVYTRALGLGDPEGWSFDEPESNQSIMDSLPPETTAASSPADLADRLLGAWQGRIAGNVVGKPFEIGPTRTSIREYLTRINAYPLLGYVPFEDGDDRSVLGMWGFEDVTESRIHGAIRDDDIDYTVLGLELLETHGVDYTTRDVAFAWLSTLPAYQVFTAERNTYQNLIREVPLENVGEFHNPFREWIGALIRADIFGFIYPGRPRAAALASIADARLSHRANGIYGEMWAAALVASAFTAATPLESVRSSLEHIPPKSRLAHEIRAVIDDRLAGLDWETAMDRLVGRHENMSWVHTINNAGALTAAILWGDGDPARTIGLSVQAGLDTDSIGASAGSWVGAFVGAAVLPDHLVEPLEDTYRSGVFGVGTVRITELAARTEALAVANSSL